MTKEITAVYLKITNLKNQFGGMDYHGLDVTTFGTVAVGSPLYTDDGSTCYLIYNATDFAIPDDPDITLSTEEEYNAFKDELDAKKPIPTDDKIKQLENMVEMLILGNGGL
ncbi:hypothetical protein [Lysinibacillus xylanilyticus]|uniref:hypothetical protein n=1 Tax=Lysinibacillus xylanilyticus TaxID=582475 RepID=UPI003CFC5299